MIGKTVQYLRASLDRAHTFRGPPRDVASTLLRATVYHDGERVLGFEVDVRLDHGEYLAAAEDHAFELGPDTQGQSLGGALQDGQPVFVTLFLRHDIVPSWFTTASECGSEASEAVAGMASPDHPLGCTGAWVFVSVMQDVPGQVFQVGFKHAAYEELDSHLML